MHPLRSNMVSKSSRFVSVLSIDVTIAVKGAENLEAVVDTVQIGGLYQLKQKTFGLGTDTPASIPQGSSGIVGRSFCYFHLILLLTPSIFRYRTIDNRSLGRPHHRREPDHRWARHRNLRHDIYGPSHR